MANKAITDLAPITKPFANDYLLVVHNAGAIPTTNIVTVNNFANSVVAFLPYASSSSAGVVKAGTNLSVNSTGYMSTTIISTIARQTTSAYSAKSTDDLVLVDQVAANTNCTVILPSSSTNGKSYRVKIISDGGFATNVVVDNGSSFDGIYPSLTLSFKYSLNVVFYNGVYYVINQSTY